MHRLREAYYLDEAGEPQPVSYLQVSLGPSTNPDPNPNPNPNPNPTPNPSPDPHQAKRELAKSGGNDYMGALSTNDNSLEELSAHGTDRRLHTARPLPARPAQHRPSTGHLHLCL